MLGVVERVGADLLQRAHIQPPPQVEWKELWGRAYTSQIETSFKEGGDVWFDSTALVEFRQKDQELEAWLLANCRINESYEFPVGDHMVGFTRLQKLKSPK